MPYCNHCGAPVSEGGSFCPSCGAAVAGATPTYGALPGQTGPSTGPVAPSGYGLTYGYPSVVGPTPASSSADRHSLALIEWVAVLLIASGVVGAVFEFSGAATGLFSATTTSAGTTLSLPSPWIWFAYLGGLAAVDLVVLVLMRMSFRALVPVDGTFSTPASLALVALIGALVALAGAALLLDAVYSALNCVGSGQPITSGCLFSGPFVAGAALLVIGGIAALVGGIGILIGIWRLGTRHNESLFKVAAILLILPFLNIVGAILMLVGARSSRHRLDAMVGASPYGAH